MKSTVKNSELYSLFTCLFPSHYKISTIALKTMNVATVMVTQKTNILGVIRRGISGFEALKSFVCREMHLTSVSLMETPPCSLVFILPDAKLFQCKDNECTNLHALEKLD